jgi:hypothetical protein
MGANQKIGISKEYRDLANRYSKRMGLYDYNLVLSRPSKRRTVYFIGTDINNITYRIRFDKIRLMRPPNGNQVVNIRDYLVHQSNLTHGEGTYDLSLVKESDITFTNKIEIICKTHGVFKKTKSAFITARQGCPTCSKNRFNNNRKYFKK